MDAPCCSAVGDGVSWSQSHGTEIAVKCLQHACSSRGVQMATAAQEYRNNAAACLRLSKTMNDDNKRRLEEIAQRWLELAKQEEQGDQGYLEAAE